MLERCSNNQDLETVECQCSDELAKRTLFWKSHAFEGDADSNTRALRYSIAIYSIPKMSPED